MSDKSMKISQGSEFLHPVYGKFKVLSFVNSKSVEIQFFNTNTIVRVQSKDVRSLRVRDYNYPSMFGVGYKGYGKHKSFYGGKVRKSYSTWRSMLQRCYDKECESYRFYHACSVCDEWLNFQAFAEWYEENYVDGFQIDKDKKIKGNRVYSPEACVFISREENTRIATQKKHTFISPGGDAISFVNLTEFCLVNKLDRVNMSRVSNGHRKSHKGWTAARATE